MNQPELEKEKEKAKQVIYEIIRQAGGEFHNKTNMYKAFWIAHREYARDNPGYLSLWPIVRMPWGPGIDNFDELIGELVADGLLEIKQCEPESYGGFFFSKTDKAPEFPGLSKGEMDAIRAGVNFAQGKSATCVSTASHEMSRSWREAKDGEELDIYADLMSDEELEEKQKKMAHYYEVLKAD